MGPFTWSRVARSRVERAEAIVIGVICPLEASRQSKVMVSPDWMWMAGGILIWNRTKLSVLI